MTVTEREHGMMTEKAEKQRKPNRRTSGWHYKNKRVPPSRPASPSLPSAPDLEALGWVYKLFLSDLNIWPLCPVPAIKHSLQTQASHICKKTNEQASQCPLQQRVRNPFQNTITLFVCLPLFALPHFYVEFMLWGDLNMVCVCVCRRTFASPRSI